MVEYSGRVLESFGDRQTEKLWNSKRHKLPVVIEGHAAVKLSLLAAAISLDEVRIPPGNHLEALKVGRTGQHSIRINSQSL
jgi:proteic killer suppression protein